jgi:NAD-dependent deacetylase
MKKIVFFTGAGISAESGIPTFRGEDGLWNNFAVDEVASMDAWNKNPEMVLEFHNEIRKLIESCEPNDAHRAIASLVVDPKFEVCVVTQNIDDLHERAGSPIVYHVHGRIFQAKSSLYPSLVYGRKDDIHMGDVDSNGHQLRHNTVLFGEILPKMDYERSLMEFGLADIIVVVGTSLQVYPAAGLLQHVKDSCEIIVVDPNTVTSQYRHIPMKASEGVPILVKQFMESQ